MDAMLLAGKLRVWKLWANLCQRGMRVVGKIAQDQADISNKFSRLHPLILKTGEIGRIIKLIGWVSNLAQGDSSVECLNDIKRKVCFRILSLTIKNN
jgi:hypothetical protein